MDREWLGPVGTGTPFRPDMCYLCQLRMSIAIVPLVRLVYQALMIDEKKDQRIPVMMTTTEVARIDQWRGKQAGVPSRAEAIRRLVEKGLSSG